MKRFLTLGVLATALLSVTTSQAVTIDVTPVIHPNAFGSPNWVQSYQNGNIAIQDNLNTYGSGPATWTEVTGPLSVFDTTVTGFPSWNGSADPVGDYGAAYSGEHGNRLHFDFHAYVDSPLQFIDVSALSFNAVSTDPHNTLNFGFASGYTYSPNRLGIIWGPDGVRGGGDDTVLTSGTGPVNEIIGGGGSGNAWAIYDTDPGATRQDKLDGVLTKYGIGEDYNFDFTGTYSLGIASGSATVHYQSAAVSTPDAGGTSLLLGGAFAAIGLLRRRK